jgi:hypothetical protein
VIRSIPLDVSPTAREAQTILSHVEDELRSLGASVQQSQYGAIHFKLPRPWRARHLGILHVVSSGRATIGAAGGAPWRVRYELKFTMLQWLATALSTIVVVVGFQTGRFITFYGLVAVWLVCYVLPYVAATVRFRNLVRARVQEVVRQVYRTGEMPGRTGETRTSEMRSGVTRTGERPSQEGPPV